MRGSKVTCKPRVPATRGKHAINCAYLFRGRPKALRRLEDFSGALQLNGCVPRGGVPGVRPPQGAPIKLLRAREFGVRLLTPINEIRADQTAGIMKNPDTLLRVPVVENLMAVRRKACSSLETEMLERRNGG